MTRFETFSFFNLRSVLTKNIFILLSVCFIGLSIPLKSASGAQALESLHVRCLKTLEPSQVHDILDILRDHKHKIFIDQDYFWEVTPVGPIDWAAFKKGDKIGVSPPFEDSHSKSCIYNLTIGSKKIGTFKLHPTGLKVPIPVVPHIF